MSLFDILRYPISDVPTYEELVALPDDLFNNWVSQTDWRKPYMCKTPERIAEWYNNTYRKYCADVVYLTDKDEIKLLRKLISEYDNI